MGAWGWTFFSSCPTPNSNYAYFASSCSPVTAVPLHVLLLQPTAFHRLSWFLSSHWNTLVLWLEQEDAAGLQQTPLHCTHLSEQDRQNCPLEHQKWNLRRKIERAGSWQDIRHMANKPKKAKRNIFGYDYKYSIFSALESHFHRVKRILPIKISLSWIVLVLHILISTVFLLNVVNCLFLLVLSLFLNKEKNKESSREMPVQPSWELTKKHQLHEVLENYSCFKLQQGIVRSCIINVFASQLPTPAQT